MVALMEALKNLFARKGRADGDKDEKEAALQREAAQEKRLQTLMDSFNKEEEIYRLMQQQGVRKPK